MMIGPLIAMVIFDDKQAKCTSHENLSKVAGIQAGGKSKHFDQTATGLNRDRVEVAQLEDGQGIGTEKCRYEWWYVDAHLDDGATVVVVFYTKPNVSPNGPLALRIQTATLSEGVATLVKQYENVQPLKLCRARHNFHNAD